MKKIRVLILAEAANPEWTSVPLIGWSLTKALAKTHNIHLVTHLRNKEALEKTGWQEGVEFTCINTEKLAKPAYKIATFLRGKNQLGWTITTAISSIIYPYFEYLSWKKFSRRLENQEFDIVHRITPVTPTSLSFISRKLKSTGIPFVIGPLNGGTPWPKQFTEIKKQEKEWLSYLRPLAMKFLRCSAAFKYYDAIIYGSKAAQSDLPKSTQHRQFYIPENAIDTDRFNRPSKSNFSRPIRACFIGRLVPYKGAHMAIQAIAPLAHNGKITFDIYGEGPQKGALKKLIAKNHLEATVNLHGFVRHTELQDRLSGVDILIFPSIREFGGGVVLEAMALGIIPVVADYAGPAELVDDTTGYKIPISPEKQLISDLNNILKDITDNPCDLIAKRNQCMRKVQSNYTWKEKARKIDQIYRWLITRQEKPNFK